MYSLGTRPRSEVPVAQVVWSLPGPLCPLVLGWPLPGTAGGWLSPHPGNGGGLTPPPHRQRCPRPRPCPTLSIPVPVSRSSQALSWVRRLLFCSQAAQVHAAQNRERLWPADTRRSPPPRPAGRRSLVVGRGQQPVECSELKSRRLWGWPSQLLRLLPDHGVTVGAGSPPDWARPMAQLQMRTETRSLTSVSTHVCKILQRRLSASGWRETGSGAELQTCCSRLLGQAAGISLPRSLLSWQAVLVGAVGRGWAGEPRPLSSCNLPSLPGRGATYSLVGRPLHKSPLLTKLIHTTVRVTDSSLSCVERTGIEGRGM